MSDDMDDIIKPQGRNDATVTAWRLDRIDETLKGVCDTLQQLAILEQRHAETRDSLSRNFTAIEKLENRMREMELEMPMLRQVKSWIMTGVLAFIGLAGTAVWDIIQK